MAKYERLSTQDTSLLHRESPAEHMHVGGLAIVEHGGWSDDELDAHFASRLHLAPRFRKKLAWSFGHLGRPLWVDDPHFDIRFHVRHTGLPRGGGEREALRLMGRIMSRPLDRQRPLWEIWVFELPEERVGIIQKTHPCMIDGIGGVDLSTVVFDPQPEPQAAAAPPSWRPEALPSAPRLAVGALTDGWTRPVELLRQRREAHRSRLASRRALDVGKGLLALGRANLGRAPKTSLSGPIGPHRRFETVRVSLEDARALKDYFYCTVNDVVLALVTAGLRRLLRERGDSIDGLVLKATLPVSISDTTRLVSYGVAVSAITVELPVGEADPRRRIEFIRHRMGGLKQSEQVIGADFWAKLSDYAPPTVLALAGRASAAHQGANLIVTNVPGPQLPLYLKGARLLEAFPYAPILGTTSVGVAVESYAGQLNFGLTGDYDLVADLDVLGRGIADEVIAMKRLAASAPGVQASAG